MEPGKGWEEVVAQQGDLVPVEGEDGESVGIPGHPAVLQSVQHVGDCGSFVLI